MGKTFNQKVLGDIAYLVRESYVPKDGNKIPYIGLEHIGQGTLTLDSFGWSTEVTSIKSRFSKGDILFGKLRPYFRKVIQAPFDGICSTDIWVVRAKEGINQRFLYYLMASQDFIDYVTQGSDGTKMPRANWSYASQFSFDIPSYTVQSQIGNILGSLDDKIALNNRMNLTLEEMARTIFKSWFVDFDPVRARAEGRDPGLPAEIADLFPDSFEDSPLGEIPRGWRVGTIGEVTKVVGGSTPSTKESKFWDGGTYHWATPKDLSGLSSPVMIRTERKITPEGLDQISSGLLPKGTVLLSSRAPIGYLAITNVPTAVNQGFIALVCDGELPNVWILLWLQHNMEEIKSRANGTTFQEISKANFRPINLVIPNTEIIDCFRAVVQPLFDRITANLLENETLANIRDLLIPSLINGEKRI